jgi:hypothetical protein
LARLVDSRQLALTGRPQRMRAGFRHARDRGLRRTDAPMQLRAVTLFRMDSCLSRERRSPHGLRRFLYCSHTRCLQCGCRRTSSRHCPARLEPPRDRARVRFICAVGAFRPQGEDVVERTVRDRFGITGTDADERFIGFALIDNRTINAPRRGADARGHPEDGTCRDIGKGHQ